MALRFLMGLAIGFGVGFAGAVLFAPERKKGERVGWPAGPAEAAPAAGPDAFDADRNIMASVKRALRSVQEQVSEALEEAKKAQAEKEREMRAKYEGKVHHARHEAAEVEEGKKTVKGEKKGK